MAVEKETQLEAWLEENMPEPGGGNPNYIETVSGTVAEPFGKMDFIELATELENGGVTLRINVSRYQMIGQIWQAGILFSACMFDLPTDSAPFVAASAYYESSGSLYYAKSLVNSTYIDVPTTTPTRLEIIHHPLPEN